MTLWRVDDLTVAFGERRVVEGLSYHIDAGECVALVGESGSGKSQSWLAPFGLSDGRSEGAAILAGHNLVGRDEPELRALRGGKVGFIFQQPLSALTPHLTIAAQLAETAGRIGEDRLATLLDEVGIDRPLDRLRQYPHQLSGGQRQRVMIAMAMAHAPQLLVADEPTTALDASLRREIMDLIDRLRKERGMGVLLISHDLPSVARHADRIVVMRHGHPVESGPARTLLSSPQADYSRALVAATPRLDAPAPTLPPIGAPLIDAREVQVRFRKPGWRGGWIDAVAGVSFDIAEGEAVGLVGGSGSGKSSLARAVVRLGPMAGGTVNWRGRALPTRRDMGVADRRGFQPVFQDPVGSLDPRWTATQSIEEPLLRLRPELRAGARRDRVAAAMDEVGLDQALAGRLPRQLSGGQAQRVALARALVSEPDLLVLDEATSALDVLVQAAIVERIAQIQRERKLALLVISHDIALVRNLCHRILVLDQGRVVETGATQSVIAAPSHEITRALVAAS